MNPVAQALLRPEAYPHPVSAETGIQLVETHISWIFLTGKWAYKLKKPLDLGFLDFSTLQRRELCCHEEVRLNRRLCPDIYLGVSPVTVADGVYRVDGQGRVADYLVRMLQFDRNLEIDRLLAAERLPAERIREIAAMIARFHQCAEPAAPETPYGTPAVLLEPMLENLDITEQLRHAPEETVAMERIRQWTLDEHRRLSPGLSERKAEGFIRACHGDLHTSNMVILNGHIRIFDCIEFNPKLSIIDVISDIAFLFMDLEHAARKDYAWLLLNTYLSATGDYAGLRMLRLYLTYRAMVRAKVTAIRFSQSASPIEKAAALEAHRSYLRLASGYLKSPRPVLVLMHGVSGSGKSQLAARLSETAGCVVIRSDVERKRLFGLEAHEGSRSSGVDIYTPEAGEKTYATLFDQAGEVLSGGFSVIIDATFLKRSNRRPFMELAERLGCRCRIITTTAERETLRQRVAGRLEEGCDPSEANLQVLAGQLLSLEGLDDREATLGITVDTQGRIDHAAIAAAVFG